jgi:hypothetical protein
VNANEMLNGRFLNASDLRGRPSVRVTIATVNETRFRDGTSKLVLSFEGAKKQLALNKTNLRAAIAVLGPETESWPGGRLTLVPQKVDFGGQLVDAVRIASPAEPPRQAPPPPPARPSTASRPAREPGDDFPEYDVDPELGF